VREQRDVQLAGAGRIEHRLHARFHAAGHRLARKLQEAA
jgi:hypothetical protein